MVHFLSAQHIQPGSRNRMASEGVLQSPAAFRPPDAPERLLLRDRKAIETYFNGDCSAMKPGDETVYTENLAIKDLAYYCSTCRYTEQIFRLLVNDWRDRETVWSPEFLPLMIMTEEEIMAHSCPDCERGAS